MLGWLEWILRFVFLWIDKAISAIIDVVYNTLLWIANTSILDSSVIESFASRIYALLGIFMLFKVTFSLITYLVNPDAFSDKSKGVGKMITNIVIVVILLATTPLLFRKAYELQKYILSENVISNLLLGTRAQNELEREQAGKEMAFTVYSAFFTPDSKTFSELSACDDMYSWSLKELRDPNGPFAGCRDAILALDPEKTDEDLKTLQSGLLEKDTSKLLSTALVTSQPQGKFTFQYIPIISSLCGGFVAYILLMFCFDIGLRSVKLSFLQLIAPIPIISYVDPKSGQSGMFSKWVKTCLSTYADLFLRLAAIYFAIFVVSAVRNSEGLADIATGNSVSFWSHPVGGVFLILGALIFAKKLPSLLENLFGIKFSGDFTLNPMKRLASTPIVGTGLATGLGMADSLANHKGAWAGIKSGFKAVPLKGDASKSIFGGMAYRAENQKARLEAKQARRLDAERMKKGKALYEQQMKLGINGDDAKADIFGHKEYKDSYLDVGRKKTEMYIRKNEVSKAQGDYSAASTQYQSVLASHNALTNEYDAILASHDGDTTHADVVAAKQKVDMNAATLKEAERRMNDAYDGYSAASKVAGQAEARYEMAKAHHANLKKLSKYSSDAEKEDAIDYYDKMTGDSERTAFDTGIDFTKAKNKYDNAVASGNQDEIDKALEKLNKAEKKYTKAYSEYEASQKESRRSRNEGYTSQYGGNPESAQSNSRPNARPENFSSNVFGEHPTDYSGNTNTFYSNPDMGDTTNYDGNDDWAWEAMGGRDRYNDEENRY